MLRFWLVASPAALLLLGERNRLQTNRKLLSDMREGAQGLLVSEVKTHSDVEPVREMSIYRTVFLFLLQVTGKMTNLWGIYLLFIKKATTHFNPFIWQISFWIYLFCFVTPPFNYIPDFVLYLKSVSSLLLIDWWGANTLYSTLLYL